MWMMIVIYAARCTYYGESASVPCQAWCSVYVCFSNTRSWLLGWGATSHHQQATTPHHHYTQPPPPFTLSLRVFSLCEFDGDCSCDHHQSISRSLKLERIATSQSSSTSSHQQHTIFIQNTRRDTLTHIPRAYHPDTERNTKTVYYNSVCTR